MEGIARRVHGLPVHTGRVLAVVPEHHQPAVGQAQQVGRRVGGAEAGGLGLGPLDPVRGERFVEETGLGPDQHPDPAVPKLDRYRFGRAVVAADVAAAAGRGEPRRREPPAPAAVVRGAGDDHVGPRGRLRPQSRNPELVGHHDPSALELEDPVQGPHVAFEDPLGIGPPGPAVPRRRMPDVVEVIHGRPPAGAPQHQHEGVELSLPVHQHHRNAGGIPELELDPGLAPGDSSVAGTDRGAVASGDHVENAEFASRQRHDRFSGRRRLEQHRRVGTSDWKSQRDQKQGRHPGDSN